ncbi:DNA starvation/stationary phase protection protein [Candidatus Babeliales bacterium]|nr:DNA starvation/stationary phase protection protein [Candidatus Babeliales bacterium]
MKKYKKSFLFIVFGITSYFATQAMLNNEKEREPVLKEQRDMKELEPNIGIEKEDRTRSISILNEVLSNTSVLLFQTLNYHWNLVGPQFNDYHKLLDGQYHELFSRLDDIAERIRAIGGIAVASMSEMAKNASLKEDTDNIPQPTDMIKNLLQQHESLIRMIRSGIEKTTKDVGTNNFLTDLIEKHEKTAWMLRSLIAR